MQRKQASLPRSPERYSVPYFMTVPGMKGARDRVFPLQHMHYVSRSFRLLNPFASVHAPSEHFSGRKFHRTEIFCRKPKGKRGDPQGRANFDEEGETFAGMVILSGVEEPLPDNIRAC